MTDTAPPSTATCPAGAGTGSKSLMASPIPIGSWDAADAAPAWATLRRALAYDGDCGSFLFEHDSALLFLYSVDPACDFVRESRRSPGLIALRPFFPGSDPMSRILHAVQAATSTYTTEEAAATIGISCQTLQAWIAAKKITSPETYEGRRAYRQTLDSVGCRSTATSIEIQTDRNRDGAQAPFCRKELRREGYAPNHSFTSACNAGK